MRKLIDSLSLGTAVIFLFFFVILPVLVMELIFRLADTYFFGTD